MKPDPRLLGITDSAKRAGVTRQAIRQAIDRGEIRVERIASRDYPIVEDLERWIANPTRQRLNPRA